MEVDLDLAALEREGRTLLDEDRLAHLLETLVRDAEVFGEGANAYEAGVTDTMRAVRDALDIGTDTDDADEGSSSAS